MSHYECKQNKIISNQCHFIYILPFPSFLVEFPLLSFGMKVLVPLVSLLASPVGQWHRLFLPSGMLVRSSSNGRLSHRISEELKNKIGLQCLAVQWSAGQYIILQQKSTSHYSIVWWTLVHHIKSQYTSLRTHLKLSGLSYEHFPLFFRSFQSTLTLCDLAPKIGRRSQNYFLDSQ